MKKLTVVILAAGLGTRMRSRKAKVLHEAGGLPLIEHVVRSATAVAAPERTVVVVGHQADAVERVLAGRGLLFARQTEQRGTGHAVACCEPVVPDKDGHVIILYGDCPLLSAETIRRLLDHHLQTEAVATVITTELENPTGYGRVIIDEQGFIREIVEEKAANPEQKAVRLINSGIYCFDAAILWNFLAKVEPNPASNEYYLTDIVEILNRGGYKVGSLKHCSPDELLGINTRVELAYVDSIFRERKNRELMLGGVTIVKPETVLVDVDVQVGSDTVLGPFVQLLGSTTIANDCHIGAGSVLQDCVIEHQVVISPYTLAGTSRIDSGATVGPFARLRMENHVEANAHIGNFVELKKTRFRSGAKAGHLAYLGDSDIGAETNIGAGTITCNFDGKRKHRTEIGEGAFIGSNSTLVAPVQIGAGAYVAAGSVITDPVPGDALGIGRGRQVNKEQWAKKRRESSAAGSGNGQ